MSEWFARYGWGPIRPGLFTGSYPQDAADVAVLRSAGVSAVVNLCHDEEYAPGSRAAVQAAYAAGGITEWRLASVDYGDLAPELLDRAVAAVGALLDAGVTVYVHCRAGWQRSATVAAAVLAVRLGIGPDAALAEVCRARPVAQPLPHQVQGLLRWWRVRVPAGGGGTPGG